VDAGDVAAFVAAVAALGALGTSLWTAAYTSRRTAELERARWLRGIITADVMAVARAIRRQQAILDDEEGLFLDHWDESKTADRLAALELLAPTAMATACQDLRQAVQAASNWIEVLKESGGLVPRKQMDDDYQEAFRVAAKQHKKASDRFSKEVRRVLQLD